MQISCFVAIYMYKNGILEIYSQVFMLRLRFAICQNKNSHDMPQTNDSKIFDRKINPAMVHLLTPPPPPPPPSRLLQ